MYSIQNSYRKRLYRIEFRNFLFPNLHKMGKYDLVGYQKFIQIYGKIYKR